jgi:N6-L-threonylcarbamoyladenine synthase
MRILAIETSCDDTAISILEVKKPASTQGGTGKSDTFKILANNTNSQVKIHAEYGGVFPALAKREHQKNLPILFEKTLKEAKTKIEKTCPVRSREGSQRVSTSNGIDLIAVTSGPGLEPALWTGIVFAKELSKKYNIPVVPVNHMEGHMFSIFPKKGKTFTICSDKKIFPMLSLLVSGGHTELVLVKSGPSFSAGKLTYKKIGQTRDDASGEAFDKVARMLGLPYPGGPEISKLANIERENISPLLSEEGAGGGDLELISHHLALKGTPPQKGGDKFILPRPMMYSKDYDFSFSGLKTAALYLIRDLKEKNPNILDNMNIKQKIAREFEDAIVETLVYKTIKAIKEYKIKTLIVGGGVSANAYLQKQMKKEINNLRKSDFLNVKVHFPIKSLTGDNAIMIAIAGYFQYKNKKTIKNLDSIKAKGNLSL